eukprot:GHVP01007356.1.p1 GENE.GHVP01007356.1~~GHVP01007356.1.p1  ORF type:complete len:879 (+),score=182.19 GHVP01007356.1:991-3627(+)
MVSKNYLQREENKKLTSTLAVPSLPLMHDLRFYSLLNQIVVLFSNYGTNFDRKLLKEVLHECFSNSSINPKFSLHVFFGMSEIATQLKNSSFPFYFEILKENLPLTSISQPQPDHSFIISERAPLSFVELPATNCLFIIRLLYTDKYFSKSDDLKIICVQCLSNFLDELIPNELTFNLRTALLETLDSFPSVTKLLLDFSRTKTFKFSWMDSSFPCFIKNSSLFSNSKNFLYPPNILVTVTETPHYTRKLFEEIKNDFFSFKNGSPNFFNRYLISLGVSPKYESQRSSRLLLFLNIFNTHLDSAYDEELSPVANKSEMDLSNQNVEIEPKITFIEKETNMSFPINSLSFQCLRWFALFTHTLAFNLLKSTPVDLQPSISRSLLIRALCKTSCLLKERNERMCFLSKEKDWEFLETKITMRQEALNLLKNIDMSSNFVENSQNITIFGELDDSDSESDLESEDNKQIFKSQTLQESGLLRNLLILLPHSIPFSSRLEFMHSLLLIDKKKIEREELTLADLEMDRFTFIGRGTIVEDALDTIGRFSPLQMKRTIRIQFFDSTGTLEEGIDGGGVFKEFLIEFCRTIFSTGYSLFLESSDSSYYPSPSAFYETKKAFDLFRLCGSFFGKAVYENTLVEPILNRVFIQKILGKSGHVDDLRLLDEEFFNSLKMMTRFEGDFDNLGLSFTASIRAGNKVFDVPIIPGGESIKVDKGNRFKFVHTLAHFKTDVLMKRAADAFCEGLNLVFPVQILKIFSRKEIQKIFSGDKKGFEVEELRDAVVYSGGFDETSETIKHFWLAISEFTEEERDMFLMFLTGCSRRPLRGFSALNPKICVQREADTRRLPSASTCVNLLHLPDYQDFYKLKSRLLKSIPTKGFGLS